MPATTIKSQYPLVHSIYIANLLTRSMYAARRIVVKRFSRGTVQLVIQCLGLLVLSTGSSALDAADIIHTGVQPEQLDHSGVPSYSHRLPTSRQDFFCKFWTTTNSL